MLININIIDVVSRWREYASAVDVSREHADYIGERLMLLTKLLP